MNAPTMLPWMILFLLCFFSGNTIGQNDPVKNFCRRWGHQSAVVDGRLYIDGGLINYQNPKTNLTSKYRGLDFQNVY